MDRYLQEISEVTLLKPKEEIELARRIKKGDHEALEKLTKANLRFVVSIAMKYRNRGLPLGDLINEGNLGLITAAKRFDESRGFKFISYAIWWIRQAIIQALSQQSRVVRLPMNRIDDLKNIRKEFNKLEQEYGRESTINEISIQVKLTPSEVSETLQRSERHLSLDAPLINDNTSNFMDVIPDNHQPSPDDVLTNESVKIEIMRALKILSGREAEVVELYFGLGRERFHTLEEIGDRYNLSREWIRQIKDKALERVRQHLKS